MGENINITLFGNLREENKKENVTSYGLHADNT